MTFGEAWLVLGLDAEGVIHTIQKIEGIEARLVAVEKIFGKAQKISQQLLMKYHPDRNPGNPEVAAKYCAVNNAIEAISIYTEEFRKRVTEKTSRKPSDSLPDGFIEIKPL